MTPDTAPDACGGVRADARSAAVAERYAALQERVARASGCAFSDSGVTVVAVTKAQGAWAIDAAAVCGIGDVAENYAQECVSKLAETTVARRPRTHFVGRLQRNKIKLLAGRIDVWQTVDRAELITEISRRAPGAGIMIQVNISQERSKGGCVPESAEVLASQARDADLDLLGLMGIGPLGSPEDARSGFRLLRRMVDGFGLEHCSMGMTDDLEVAVAEGATMLRIGRGIFGERPPREAQRNPSQYEFKPK
ncbi:MAG: YggS family pyridoxal phosphate-dependent enzyme [Acidimicrobiaceae bacterium]|nr:YggS family pyridoxal phosphate-dependent enzyme [Acidimicrobiaceae bacterium]MCY4279921.1 YggS family pyridoxal phosphate-dependent enzyme [Acidimicrobiaceae bacterium]MCY4294567.1 YggS family pyridoxal phosphate-dependent enzyme [Acidimicrobiaceae bacterium]